MVRQIFYEGDSCSVFEVGFDSVLFSDDSSASDVLFPDDSSASDDCCTLAS